jgi:hypothetical protein
MNNSNSIRSLVITLMSMLSMAIAGCGNFTDAATRLASDLEAGSKQLGNTEGATYSVVHRTPSKVGECAGPYKVQIDAVGALIIWCYDASGNTVSSHSTSYHASFVKTPQTYLMEMSAGSTLTIDLERRNGQAVIVAVH